MKLFTIVAALAAVAAAAPAPAATEENQLVARQGGSCDSPNGTYRCYANISNPNDRFSFIGQCVNGAVVLIARCNCVDMNGTPYCV